MNYPIGRICPKCNEEIPTVLPYCHNRDCITYTVSKIETPKEGGMFMYTREHKYPLRGYPEPRRLNATAQVKRVFMSSLRLAFKFKILLPFILLIPKKKLIAAVIQWVEEIYQADYVKTQLQDNLYCESAREILKVLRGLYGDRLIINCAVMIYETDTAYRFPLQDLLGHILDQDKLRENYKKEILRALKVFSSRWIVDGLREKGVLLRRLVKLIFIFKPSIGFELFRFLINLDQERMKLNVNDKYWTANKFIYNYGGEDYETRMAWRLEEDRDFVPEVPDHRERAAIGLQPNISVFHLTEDDLEKLIVNTGEQIRSIYKNNKDKYGKF